MASAPVTFTSDVAPILYQNCTSCHHPGGSAPFSLVTHAEAARRASAIVDATSSGAMPPWLPDSQGHTYVGERHLSVEQIDVLRRWADEGAPLGDSARAPAAPTYGDNWALGPPDLIVQAPTYRLPARGRDVYRNLVVPIPLQESQWVTAVELRPGNRGVVHHARMMIDTTASSRELDLGDVQAPGFDGMAMRSNAANPEGHFLGWTPGKGSLPPLDGMAWPLNPGTDLVLQLHMRTTGSEEVVDAQVGLYFADAPPKEIPVLLLLSSLLIDIAPGDSDYHVTNSYTLPVPVDVLSVYPHAHYLGKELRGFATLPSGAVKELIRIPEWDFNWQDEYRFRDPVSLPAGTVLTMDFSFDNSSDNPNNPSDPPVRVVYGSNSEDEMADLILQVRAHNPSDRAELVSDSKWTNAVEDMTYMAEQAYAAGVGSLAAGDVDRAAEQFREVLQYRLDHVGALVGLTRVFIALGDAPSATVVAEQGRQVTDGRDPAALFALAQAYKLGLNPSWESVARDAVRLAREQGLDALADSIQGLSSR